MGCKNLENLANRKKADWLINSMYIAYTFSSTFNKFETYNCVIIGLEYVYQALNHLEMRLLSQDSDCNNVRIQSTEVIIIVQVQNTRLVSN